tara:strand:+ start:112 stop:294 length:183 start_codon:yes stop_codon:yes gene_type:complete
MSYNYISPPSRIKLTTKDRCVLVDALLLLENALRHYDQSDENDPIEQEDIDALREKLSLK